MVGNDFSDAVTAVVARTRPFRRSLGTDATLGCRWFNVRELLMKFLSPPRAAAPPQHGTGRASKSVTYNLINYKHIFHFSFWRGGGFQIGCAFNVILYVLYINHTAVSRT